VNWSQLKKRFEMTFADCVRGRIEFRATSYRHAHDQAGECWITLDKKKIFTMADWTFESERHEEATRLRRSIDCTDWRNPEQREGYLRADEQALMRNGRDAVHSKREVMQAMTAYLNTGIDAALVSTNPLVRAFAMLDRRTRFAVGWRACRLGPTSRCRRKRWRAAPALDRWPPR
jgi:hypothetical protein